MTAMNVIQMPASPSQEPRRRTTKGARGYYAIERDHGRWTGYGLDPHQQKYQGKTFDTEREALEWAAFKHAEFVTGQARAGRSKMREVADEYLADLKLHSASPGHLAFCNQVIDRAIEAGITDLNNDRVVAIARRLLTNLTKLTHVGKKGAKGKASKEPASAATKNNYMKILRAVANFGVKHRYARENHFDRLDFVPVVKPLKAVFELEELGRLVDPRNRDHPFYPVFAMQIYTGFRPGEVRHVGYDWILWDSMRIAMQIGKTIGGEGDDLDRKLVPKGGMRERRARITRFMEEHADVLKDSANRKRGPVFPHLLDVSNNRFQSLFEAYLTHCNVPVGDRTPHSTRHTWTCLMLASGENEILVQQYAGHSLKEMTAYYAREQDRYRRQVEKAGWTRGELRLRDFSPKA